MFNKQLPRLLSYFKLRNHVNEEIFTTMITDIVCLLSVIFEKLSTNSMLYNSTLFKSKSFRSMTLKHVSSKIGMIENGMLLPETCRTYLPPLYPCWITLIPHNNTDTQSKAVTAYVKSKQLPLLRDKMRPLTRTLQYASVPVVIFELHHYWAQLLGSNPVLVADGESDGDSLVVKALFKNIAIQIMWCFNPFSEGDRLYTLESDVCRRQIHSDV